MSRGSNQKLKLSYLTKIMLEKTDDEHALTMPQIMEGQPYIIVDEGICNCDSNYYRDMGV